MPTRLTVVIGSLVAFIVIGMIGTFMVSSFIATMPRCTTTPPSGVELAVTDTGQIWVSTNTGQTWIVAQQLGAPGDETAYTLADLGGGVILVGTSNVSTGSNVAEIWRSTDYGTTFTLDQQLLTEEYVTHLASLGNNIALAGTANATNSSAGIYRSSNNGITWIPNQEFVRSGFSPTWKGESSIISLGGGTALAAGGYDFLARVYRTTDYGATWSNISPTLGGVPHSDYIHSFADLGGGVVIAGMYSMFNVDQGIWRSDDYGQTWTFAQQMADCNTMVFLATSSLGNNIAVTSAIYSANGSLEIYRTLDNGQNWELAQALPGAYGWFNEVYSFTNIGDGTAIAGRANITTWLPTAGEIWRTTDYGKSWSLAQTLGTSTAVYDTLFIAGAPPMCPTDPLANAQQSLIDTFELGITMCRLIVIISIIVIAWLLLQQAGIVPRMAPGVQWWGEGGMQ